VFNEYEVQVLQDEKVLEMVTMVASHMNVLNANELHILKWQRWFLCYIDFTTKIEKDALIPFSCIYCHSA
jgi:hypothetical protein